MRWPASEPRHRGRDNSGDSVIDLRGNPGGLLEQAVRVANVFAESVPLRYLTRRGEQVEERLAVQGGAATTIPLVVLVNEKTASGAEMIAAALKDRNRAVVVGQRTMGTGTIQVVYEYGDTDGRREGVSQVDHCPTAFAASGALLDGLGVVPDIALARTSPDGAPAPTVSEEDTGPKWNPFVDPTIPRLPTGERALCEVAYTAPEPHPRGSPDRPPLDDFENPPRPRHSLADIIGPSQRDAAAGVCGRGRKPLS